MKQLIKLLLIVSILIGCQSSKDSLPLDSNFVHVVYIWLNNPESKKDRTQFESNLNTFLENSQYAKTKFVGVPAMTDRVVVDNSYTYSLIVSFSSKEEQDNYQTEPAHVKFVEDTKHLWNKVVVYDSVKN